MKTYPRRSVQPLLAAHHSHEAPFFGPSNQRQNLCLYNLEKIRFKWFASETSSVFLLAVQGIDSRLASEIIGLLRNRLQVPSQVGEAATILEIRDMMNALEQESPKEGESPQAGGSISPLSATGFLAEVNNWIEENLGNEDFKGSDLAKKLCCCEMQLYRRIKRLAKLSTANYIRRYRLYRSAQMLQNPALSISSICFHVGFSSLEYFSRSFKKEFGYCPSAYRGVVNV